MKKFTILIVSCIIVSATTTLALAEGQPPEPPSKPEPPAREESDNDPVQSKPFALCCVKRPGLTYCTPGETPETQPVEPVCPVWMHPADDPWALWRKE